jgi:hypothetical protein
VIPSTIAASRSAPTKKNILGESICGPSDLSNGTACDDGTVGSVVVQKSTSIEAEPEPTLEADYEVVAGMRE